MGVDYTLYLGIGKQMRIGHTTFLYARFRAMEEGVFEERYPQFELMLTSDSKGTVCDRRLFVGRVAFDRDARHTEPLPIEKAGEFIQSARVSDEELRNLEEACEFVRRELGFAEVENAFSDENVFGEYGVHILVRCW